MSPLVVCRSARQTGKNLPDAAVLDSVARCPASLFLFESLTNRSGLTKDLAELHQHAIALAAKLELPDSLSSNDQRCTQFVHVSATGLESLA